MAVTLSKAVSTFTLDTNSTVKIDSLMQDDEDQNKQRAA